VLQNSSNHINSAVTSLNITCSASSCPANLTQFSGLPVLAGAGAGSAVCDSVTAISADGFTCQLSGEFSSSGGNVFLIVNTITTESDKTCFGESVATLVAVVPRPAEPSSGSTLSSAALSLLASLTSHL
jgi:hypothetical protein